MKSKLLSTLFTLLLFVQGVLAQDSTRYLNEVDNLISKEYHFNNDKPTILFAGSSSIRRWDNIDSYFPDYNVIKNGFGGSQFSDLIYFYDQLILGFADYNPDVLFIYEGDNDIANGKKPSYVIKDAKHLLSMIRDDFPEMHVVFISVKPSIRRWNLKKSYVALNKKLRKLCSKSEKTSYVDVWSIMLDKNSELRKSLFIEDGLHLNPSGYELWTSEITRMLNYVLDK